MSRYDEKIPNPKELEKEISDFLAKKFGDGVKVVSPVVMAEPMPAESEKSGPKTGGKMRFDLKPEELIAYLDRYIVRQDRAKAILATKICTHFNRIQHTGEDREALTGMVGRIKNNVLMIGPTGVGKTYMIRLIANRIGVPFVKGDATKFSETGYVGGDVEDLVRDLVREAEGDLQRAQYGIIYIDEIDKIASSHNLVGADVSRTGVQRALLKPLEETEVELKVPHDPIAMIQEIERYRKTGERDKGTINTRNILFIVSGAFADLAPIVKKRMTKQGIGFGADIRRPEQDLDILQHARSEDFIAFGFESEFVGRLPVRAVFEQLGEKDLFEILRNPNNPIILGKKLDFASYGIDIKLSEEALRLLATHASAENTGARGLVSAVERALLTFEKHLPSTDLSLFPVTRAAVEDPDSYMEALLTPENRKKVAADFARLADEEKRYVADYIRQNEKNFCERFGLTLTESRISAIAEFYARNVMDIGRVVRKVKALYDEIKSLELSFYKKHDINIILEDNAVDYILEQVFQNGIGLSTFSQRLSTDFEHGLKLIRDKTGRTRFFISREALSNPEAFMSNLIKKDLTKLPDSADE
jgi:endopeptidase Clp ATP-binding regulatory subunit ClpX